MKKIRYILLITILALVSNNVFSQTKDNPKELEKHLEPIVKRLMERLYAPGTVIAVVKDGKLFFTKGYGYSNVEKKTPVVPDKTIFRIGSITKVFTANAAVQLADKGKIKLDEDVNKYLENLKLDKNFSEPVTVASLLSHTAGLDEISLGRRTPNPNKVIPLKTFLKDRLIRRQAPNKQISYSTYGITLAGYLVEEQTGLSLGEYFEKNIFKPLEMNRTNLGGVPSNRKDDLAIGYTFNGQYNVMDFEYFHTYPASDINSTAIDMANYIIAHLQYGKYKNSRILSEKYAREMHRQQFTNHPMLPGWALGFYETVDNNLKGLEHGGSMEGYAALLYILPEKNFGIFVASNIEQGRLMGGIKDEILDYYFPASRTPDNPELHKELRRYAGQYRWDVYCHTCDADKRGFFPRPFRVGINKEGTLSFFGRRWKMIKPLVFQAILNDDRKIYTVFKENENGEITFMLNGNNAYERVKEEN